MSIKRTAKVESLISQLESIQLKFQEMKDAREEGFSNKSEQWQESAKGEEFSEDTEALGEVIDELQSAYDSIDSLFEEI